MVASETVAISIFVGYFGLIIALFSLIFYSLRKEIQTSLRSYKIWLFSFLSVASFAHTWYYMITFLLWSFEEYELRNSTKLELSLKTRITSWLMNTALFEQAWAAVCSRPLNWWWSEPLCLFTIGFWTIFLAIKGREHNVRYLWAYMLLGQLVAISIASNLFYLAILSHPSSKKSRSPLWTSSRTPPVLWMSTLIALGTVAISPFTNEKTFIWNLLTMHSIIVLPLLPCGWRCSSSSSTSSASSHSTSSPGQPRPTRTLQADTLLKLITFSSLLIRSRTTWDAFNSTPNAHNQDLTNATLSLSLSLQKVYDFLAVAKNTLYSHPAQSSIGWDVIWTTISFLAWLCVQYVPEFTRSTSTSSPKKFLKGSGKRTLNCLLLFTCVVVETVFGSIGIGASLAVLHFEKVAAGLKGKNDVVEKIE
ncbi:hypothetical protein K474DRAFT_1599379 [Panus rudis PR-1116 ss-1]|nr:hypothetical protein K474DRAFT_1599379 [Panus rudis PR-1116 ss-1]